MDTGNKVRGIKKGNPLSKSSNEGDIWERINNGKWVCRNNPKKNFFLENWQFSQDLEKGYLEILNEK